MLDRANGGERTTDVPKLGEYGSCKTTPGETSQIPSCVSHEWYKHEISVGLSSPITVQLLFETKCGPHLPRAEA
jgi:hypothetical protein